MIDLAVISSFIEEQPPTLKIVEVDELGFVHFDGCNLLTFIEHPSFLAAAEANPFVKAALWNSAHPRPNSRLRLINTRSAKSAFWHLHNSLPDRSYKRSQIAKSAVIHESVVVPKYGVVVGERTFIEPNVTLYSGVTIGDDCVIRGGCQIGSDALDIKADDDGNLVMSKHHGRVHIDTQVEIGHNSVVDKALFRQQVTVIGAQTKIGCLVNISHGVELGKRNKIAGGVCISGSTKIGNDNWFGPNATVSHLKQIGSGCYIAMGSVVLQDLEDGWKVVSNKVFKERKLF